MIKLDVGGTFYTTLLSTLRKDPTSMLAAMFSGRHVINKTEEGRFFIDRDGSSFKYILQYLRDGKTPPSSEAYEEACYYQTLETYECIRVRKSNDVLMTKLRERLGDKYKGLLSKFMDLLEKKRSDFLEKCFDGYDDYERYDCGDRGKSVDESRYLTERCYNGKRLSIVVMDIDKARCTSCRRMAAVPVADQDVRVPVPRNSNSIHFLQELCIPSCLPRFVVKDILLQDIQRLTGEEVKCLELQWRHERSTIECSGCKEKFLYRDQTRVQHVQLEVRKCFVFTVSLMPYIHYSS